MPKVKTSFREDWLKQKDPNGHSLRDWCETTNSKYIVSCKFCRKTVRCDNRGSNQLMDHALTKSHIELTKDIITGSQLLIQKLPCDNATSDQSSKVQNIACFSKRNNTTKAELLWALKVVPSNYSYSSSKDIAELFKAMFPDSSIAAQFSVGPTKLSYLISEAAGPYFHELLLTDVKKSASPFTLMYDELSNKQIKKQLDIKIRYWSSVDGEVKVHHLNTYLMGRATGKDIASNIMKSINDNKLLLKDLIMLGSDGPNVNKTVFNIVSESKKELNLPALADVGTCTLHIVHSAFGKGVKCYGQDAVDLIIDLHNFFKLSPVRMEDFKSVQEELELSQLKFMKHVECRWLTLAPAIERVLSQWPALKQYFLIELPKRDNKISENVRFNRIFKCLKTMLNSVLTQLNFLRMMSQLLQPYLKLFQHEEPMIHILHEHMTTLTKVLLGRFMKPAVLKGKSLSDLSSLLNTKQVGIEFSDDDMELGIETRHTLQKLTPEAKKAACHGMRTFFQKASIHLLNKLPLNNVIIQEAACLKPDNRCQPWTLKSIKSLSTVLPISPPVRSDFITDEWKILQCEDIDPDWYTTIDDENRQVPKRIDHYWTKIFSIKNAIGEEKYPELTKLIKCVLILSHGNSDPERGFSQVGNFLTESRTQLSQTSISALQSTKDGLKRYDYQCHRVPITSEFLIKARTAYQSYLARLEEDKRIEAELQKAEKEKKEKLKQEKAAEEQKQKELEKKSKEAKKSLMKEKTLEAEEIQAKSEVDTYSTLIEEANERIKAALKHNDLKGVKIGQTMLEAAHKKMSDANASLNNIRVEQKNVERNKRTMLDYFCKGQNLQKKRNTRFLLNMLCSDNF